MRMRWIVCVVAVLGVGAGASCGPRVTHGWRAEPSADALDEPTCNSPKAGGQRCNGPDCLDNSSVLTGVDLGPLELRGCANSLGVRLLPGTLSPDPARCTAPGPLYLDLQAGEDGAELVAASAVHDGVGGPETVCSGGQLEGATFWVEGPPSRLVDVGDLSAIGKPPTVRQQLKVVAASHASMDYVDRALRSYQLVATGRIHVPEGDGAWRAYHRIDGVEAGLCGRAETLSSHLADDLEVKQRADWGPAPAPGSAAIIAAGETYGNDGRILLQGDEAAGWFHLACDRTALAKMHLLGYAPHHVPRPVSLPRAQPRARADAHAESTPYERVATLKMLMAYYCQLPMTKPGATLFVGRASDAPTPDFPEARWTAEGASCLSHLRAFDDDFTLSRMDFGRRTPAQAEADMIEDLRRSCEHEMPPCEGQPASARDVWETHTYRHLIHPFTGGKPRDPLPVPGHEHATTPPPSR